MADIEIVRLTAKDATGGAFASINKSLAGLQSSAMGVKSALAAVGAIGVGGAFIALAKSTIDAADNLNKLSQRVGVSVENLSKLQYAAKLSDLSTDQLGDGLRRLAVNLQAAGRGSGEAIEAFRALGFSQRELLNPSPDQALNRLAESFAGIQDGAGKTALAVQIFGRSGADLIPLLNQGSAGLKAMGDEATRLGLVVSSQAARAAEEFNDNLTRLSAQATAFGIQLGNVALPAISQLTLEMRAAVQAAGGFTQGLTTLLAGEAGNNAGRKLIEVETRLKAVREELQKLRGTFGDSEFAKGIPGLSRVKDLEIEASDLAATRDRLKKLQNIRAELVTQDAAPPAFKSKAPAIGSGAGLAARKREQDAIKRMEIQNAQEIDRIVTEARREFDQSQFRLSQDAQAKADKEALDQANKFASDLQGILSQTTSGKLQEIERQQGVLNDALISGKINAEQFGEAFKALDNERNRVLGQTGERFKEFSDEGKKALKDLQFAVEGWGRQFTDTLTDAVMTGKLNFNDLANSIIRDLIRMTIQASITIPLFRALSGGLGLGFFAKGGAFGPSGQLTAFASGGVVTRPTLFKFADGAGLMGEAGPEAIMPLKRTASGRLGVEASGGGGGVTIINQIDARSDRAEVEALARRGTEAALARDRENRRRGRL